MLISDWSSDVCSSDLRAVVAADEGAGAVGQVAELVRVDRDRVGTAERGERGVHLRQREAGETLADFLDRAQAAVLVAKQGGEVAAPGAVDVNAEDEPLPRPPLPRTAQGVDSAHPPASGGAPK